MKPLMIVFCLAESPHISVCSSFCIDELLHITCLLRWVPEKRKEDPQWKEPCMNYRKKAFDYLCELWCRSRGMELVSIQKFPPGTLTEADLEGVEILGKEKKAG